MIELVDVGKLLYEYTIDHHSRYRVMQLLVIGNVYNNIPTFLFKI